jgi:hypothetical protein
MKIQIKLGKFVLHKLSECNQLLIPSSASVDSQTLQPLPNKFSKRPQSVIREIKKNEVFDFGTLATDSTTVLSGVAAIVYFIADEGINNWLHSDNLWSTNLPSFI